MTQDDTNHQSPVSVTDSGRSPAGPGAREPSPAVSALRASPPIAPLLTSSDLATAASACALAIAWWRDHGTSGSDYRTQEIVKLGAAAAKFDAALGHLNPYVDSDDMPLDWGDDPVYGPLPAQGMEARRVETSEAQAPSRSAPVGERWRGAVSDLVERLRGPWSNGTRREVVSLMTDAADEIALLRGQVEAGAARIAEMERERDEARALVRPMVRFDVEDSLLTIQWRKSRERGVLLIISGDGTAEYSVKRKAGEYYGMNGRDFALSDGWPHDMLNEIAALSQDITSPADKEGEHG